MYMAPIVAAEAVPSAPAPAPSPRGLRRLVGAPVLLLAALLAVPWLALTALFAAVVLGARFLGEAVDYAGQVALGR